MKSKIKKYTGISLNYIISLTLILSGVLKLVGVEGYQNMIMNLGVHYYEYIYLLGAIEIASGILFIIPRTFVLGFIMVLVFFGGTISAHMSHGDNFIPQIIFVFLTSFIAFAKKEEWFRYKTSNTKK